MSYFIHIVLYDSFLSHIPTLFLKQLTTNNTYMAITIHLGNVLTTM